MKNTRSTVNEALEKWDASYWNDYIDEPLNIQDSNENPLIKNRSIIFGF